MKQLWWFSYNRLGMQASANFETVMHIWNAVAMQAWQHPTDAHRSIRVAMVIAMMAIETCDTVSRCLTTSL